MAIWKARETADPWEVGSTLKDKETLGHPENAWAQALKFSFPLKEISKANSPSLYWIRTGRGIEREKNNPREVFCLALVPRKVSQINCCWLHILYCLAAAKAGLLCKRRNAAFGYTVAQLSWYGIPLCLHIHKGLLHAVEEIKLLEASISNPAHTFLNDKGGRMVYTFPLYWCDGRAGKVYCVGFSHPGVVVAKPAQSPKQFFLNPLCHSENMVIGSARLSTTDQR